MDDGLMVLDEPLRDRSRWRPGRCTIGRAMEVVGTRSALLLMREAAYGTTRFADFAERVGVTEAVAAARLKELVAEGLLALRPYREEGQRTRQEYVLTDKGRDLVPVLLALMEWGDRWVAGPAGPPLRLEHDGCGSTVRTRLACDDGHEVGTGDIRVVRAARRTD